MSAKGRSIGERLSRAKSPEARAAVLSDWVDDWERDQRAVLQMLHEAFGARDWAQASSGIGQLRALTDKRLPALRRILAAPPTPPEG